MNRLNIFTQERLSSEDVVRIKQATSNKKLFFRIKYGFISLVKNPFKAFIALLYLVCVIVLYMQRGRLINDLLKNSTWRSIAQILPEVFRGIFAYGIPIAAILIFLLLMGFFGIPFCWVGKSFISARKAEDAFISAGIYTRVGKVPWLLGIEKDKETRKRTCEIYLNGNAKSEFEANKEKIESELGVTIDEFKEKSKRIILLYIVPGDIPKNRKAPEDPLFKK